MAFHCEVAGRLWALPACSGPVELRQNKESGVGVFTRIDSCCQLGDTIFKFKLTPEDFTISRDKGALKDYEFGIQGVLQVGIPTAPKAGAVYPDVCPIFALNEPSSKPFEVNCEIISVGEYIAAVATAYIPPGHEDRKSVV